MVKVAVFPVPDWAYLIGLEINYLGDSIAALNDGHDTLLLNGRWLHETISVNASKYFFFKFKFVEFVNLFLPV